MGIEKTVFLPGRPDTSVRYKLAINKQAVFLPPMTSLLIGTTRQSIADEDVVFPPIVGDKGEQEVTITSLDEHGEWLWSGQLSVEIRAKEYGTDRDVFVEHHFRPGDIVCGEFERLPEADWRDRKLEKFGYYIESRTTRCETCSLRDYCQLPTAICYRSLPTSGRYHGGA
jgi:hypothetical protein